MSTPSDLRALQLQCARTTAEMRLLVFEVITPDVFRAALRKLLSMAQEGHIPAMRLLFAQVVGKPPSCEAAERADDERHANTPQPAPVSVPRGQAADSKRQNPPPVVSPPLRPLDRAITLDDVVAVLGDRSEFRAAGHRSG